MLRKRVSGRFAARDRRLPARYIARQKMVAVVLLHLTLVTTGTDVSWIIGADVGAIRDYLSQVENTYVPSLIANLA